ncbi:MAG TPA: hypothetical protein PKL97_08360 [Candidatus Omnitrophota bacterium]|nr:hypothetical protein [Candidatus Omnitrophota bacterium]
MNNKRLLWFFLLTLIFALGTQLLCLWMERDSYRAAIEQAAEVIRRSVPFISDLFPRSYHITTSEGKDYFMRTSKAKLMRHVITNEILENEDAGGVLPKRDAESETEPETRAGAVHKKTFPGGES